MDIAAYGNAICSTCGSNCMLIGSKRKGEEGKKFRHCTSLKERYDTDIEGCQYVVPEPMQRSSNKPHNINLRKKPKERHMLCADNLIPDGEPDLVLHQSMELIGWWERVLFGGVAASYGGNDLVRAYRTRELMRQVEHVGRIDATPYDLMLKTLDHIEIGVDGRLETVFQAGIRI